MRIAGWTLAVVIGNTLTAWSSAPVSAAPEPAPEDTAGAPPTGADAAETSPAAAPPADPPPEAPPPTVPPRPPVPAPSVPPAPPPPPAAAPPAERPAAEKPPRSTEPPGEPPEPPEGTHGKQATSADDESTAAEELAPRPSAKGDPFGDEVDGTKAGGFSFRLLLQTRYTRLFGAVSQNTANKDDGFQLNRAFLRGQARPYKWLSAKLLIDFAELAYSNPQQALKLAYGEIRPSKRFEITVGLFKRSVSLLELLPIAAFEFADTGAVDNLIKDTQFGGRDVGAMVRVDPLPKRKWLRAYVAAFGGAGEGAEGLAGSGTSHTGPDLAAPNALFTARLTSRPVKHLDLGVDGAWRPSATSSNNLPVASQVSAGKAVTADLTYSTRAFELRGEWLWGDRTDATRGAASTFMAAWGIAAVRFPFAGVTVMPAARFEWLDADREHTDGQRYLVSGALNLDFTEKLRLLIDVSRDELRPGSFPLSSPPGVFSQSTTLLVVQAQLKI